MKTISIFKNDKTDKSEKYPDYRLVSSEKLEDGSYKNVTIGSLWKVNGEAGKHPVLRGELSSTRESEGKTYYGYSIHEDTPKSASAPQVDTRDYTHGDPDEKVEIDF